MPDKTFAGGAQPMPTVVEKSMKSEYFKQQRQVLIYTPWGYNEYTATRYDVIYVFDSQERAKFDLVHSLHDLACPTDKDETKPFKRFTPIGLMMKPHGINPSQYRL